MIRMNGRTRREGGVFLLPGLLFGGMFGLYAILAVLNVARIVIGAVFFGLGTAFAGIQYAAGAVFSGMGSGFGNVGGLIAGIVIGIALFNWLKKRNTEQTNE